MDQRIPELAGEFLAQHAWRQVELCIGLDDKGELEHGQNEPYNKVQAAQRGAMIPRSLTKIYSTSKIKKKRKKDYGECWN